MYEKKNLTYILTILEAIEKIYIYTNSINNVEQFLNLNEQLNFNACQILLLVIGEESKKIDEQLKKEHNNIPWHLMAGLRNRIAHDYRSIDPNISFDVVRNYLPALKIELIKMLSKIQFEKELLQKAILTPQYKHLKYLLDEEKS